MKLHEKLEKYLVAQFSTSRTDSANPLTPNGPIDNSVRLACSLRYFVGGSPYNIILAFGISHCKVFRSVWSTVDAVNKFQEFFITYPKFPDKQKAIAAGFQAVSWAKFNNCGGEGLLMGS